MRLVPLATREIMGQMVGESLVRDDVQMQPKSAQVEPTDRISCHPFDGEQVVVPHEDGPEPAAEHRTIDHEAMLVGFSFASGWTHPTAMALR